MHAPRNQIGAYEAKAKLGGLLKRAASGEVITIAKHGEPVARLVSAKSPDRAALAALFRQMDEIREASVLNPPDKERLSIRRLIEEGRE